MTIQQIKQRFGIIGNCQAINTAVEIATQVAPTDVTVLINGENGSGKDVFSRIIHQNSKRKHNSFIAINCGAIPEGTMDSELFGHEKGAFTSAYEARKGYFEEVDNGTIFLDEIGEMPLATQSRLLRLLENGEYLRVGSSKIKRADVRVIAATNKNLVEMIRQGKFREDLYFRLNTISISVPPLREREDDIELLFNYFALEFADKYRREPVLLSDEAVPLLNQYRWPGNVRELRNLSEKLTVLVKEEYVSPELLQDNLLIQENYLPSIVRVDRSLDGDDSHENVNRELDLFQKLITHMSHEMSQMKQEISELRKMMYMGMKNQPIHMEHDVSYDHDGAEIYTPQISGTNDIEIQNNIRTNRNGNPSIDESLSLEKKEKEMIAKALLKYKNNRKKAATELGISERTLYRKIKNYQINI